MSYFKEVKSRTSVFYFYGEAFEEKKCITLFLLLCCRLIRSQNIYLVAKTKVNQNSSRRKIRFQKTPTTSYYNENKQQIPFI